MMPPQIKIVVNRSPEGRFNLSSLAIKWMAMNGYRLAKDAVDDGDVLKLASYLSDKNKRHNPWLVKAVEALGPMASEDNSRLEVVTIFWSSYLIVSDGHLEVAISGSELRFLKPVEVPKEFLD